MVIFPNVVEIDKFCNICLAYVYNGRLLHGKVSLKQRVGKANRRISCVIYMIRLIVVSSSMLSGISRVFRFRLNCPIVLPEFTLEIFTQRIKKSITV